MPSVAIDEDICTFVQRPFIRAFVRRLTPTAVTPNQVTMLRALLGVASGALFATGTPPLMVLSAFSLILSGILDGVDGQLAVAKGCASLSGRILDGAADGVVFVAMQVGIYIYLRPHLGEFGWTGDGALALLVVSVSVLQLIGFNFWDYYRNRLRRLTGDGRGTLHTPQAVHDMLEQDGVGSSRFLLRAYLAYCRIQSILSRDRRGVGIWPSDAPEAAAAGRALGPVVRGWSYLGQTNGEAIFSVVILVAIFHPPVAWYFLLGLLILLPPYIVTLRIWTAVADGRLRTSGVV